MKKNKHYSQNPRNVEKAKPKHLQKPNPLNEKVFNKYCDDIGLTINDDEKNTLRHYMDNLMLWNTRINLVGTLEWRETLTELIIDSYYLADFVKNLNLENPNTWDLGSGAGLPGIPLRILWHDGEYRLVEAREKRALFMTNFLLKEPLQNTKVFWGRAEKFFSQEKEAEKFADLIISRAFMPYEELTEFIFPYLKKGGILLLMLNEDFKIIPPIFENSWKLEKSMEYQVNILSAGAKQTRYFHALKKI